MLSSKKRMIQILIKIVCFVLLFLALVNVLNVVTVNSSESASRLMMEDLYEQDNFDMVFLGASTVYRSYDTSKFDSILGMDTFNLGTSSQQMHDSYYLLKEVFNKDKPKYVILSISIWRLTDQEMKDEINSNLIFDYMSPSWNKLEYLFSAFTMDNFADALLPSFRGREQLELEQIPKNIEAEKRIREQPHVDYRMSDNDIYKTKGFVASTTAFENGHVGKLKQTTFDETMVSPKSMDYFTKIVDLCKQNDAELILAISPAIPAAAISTDDYKTYDQFLNKLARDNGLLYFNFNYVKPNYITMDDDMFYDDLHMNETLAGQFSNLFALMLKQYVDTGSIDKSQYFFRDFDEFYLSIDRVTNTWVEVVNNSQVTTGGFAGNYNSIEYRFSFAPAGSEEFEVFRDYSTETDVMLPKLQQGEYRVKVEARSVGTEADFEQYDIQSLVIE